MKYPPFLTVRRERFLRGFTLIEVMIVVAILGILAAIAYPSYKEFVLRGRRADAKASLQRAAHWMEKKATVAGIYPNDDTGFNNAGLNLSEGGHYTIKVSKLNTTGSTFTLTASPAGFVDSKCSSFTLTHNGIKTAGGSGTDDYCWGH